MGVKIVFLPDCPLILSLLKHKGVRAFLNKKMKNPNRGSPLNSSIDKLHLLSYFLIIFLIKFVLFLILFKKNKDIIVQLQLSISRLQSDYCSILIKGEIECILTFVLDSVCKWPFH